MDDWLQVLNSHMDDVVETLEREQMKIEVIFREFVEGNEYLYWFSVQDEQGEPCETSPFEIDAKHMEFWNECIDEEYGCHDAQPQVVMVPERVALSMAWKSPAKSVTSFERREIILRRKGT